jgi:hypothetical protein
MAIVSPMASSRPTKHSVFERTGTCHAPSDVGAKPSRRLQNKGLAKYARARRHYPAPGKEGAGELAALFDLPGHWSTAARHSDAELLHDTDNRSELLSRAREAAKAAGEILLLAASIGAILTAAVTLAAGLAYLFIV